MPGNEERQPHVEVTGVGAASAVPDVVRLDVTVRCDAVERISLEVADPEPVRARARQAAFEDARTKAEQYASLAGRTLGKVTAPTDVVQGGAQPRYELMAARAGSAGALPVELGVNTLTATVVVRWDW